MASLLNNASLLFNPAGSIISYQEDKIYSVLPKDGTGDFTFSGGDGGTRVNQQGYVEVTPANLINQSEAIGSSPWILNDTSLTANSTAAPNGTTTADTIANNGNNAAHRVYQGPFTGYGSPQTMSFSLYVKYNNHQYFSFGLTDDSVYRSQVVVDLVNGTITQNFVNTGGDTLTSTITNVGGGWYYVTGTFTYATSLIGGNAYFLCMLLNQSTFTSAGYVGTGTSVFVWGAMFNTGGVKPYQPTTDRLNYPRITYQNGRGALLSEPQRTNVNTYSQAIISANGYNLGGCSLTANNAISPDGTQNATLFTETADSNYHRFYKYGTGTASTKVWTIFAKYKPGGREWLTMDAGPLVYFNIANGTLGNTSSDIITKIEPYKDGWYRCTYIDPTSAVDLCFIGAATYNGDPGNYAGDGRDCFWVWGMQCEDGVSYPTSYIPTTSATVTRPLDNANKTGISSLIGQTEGVIYFNGTINNSVNPFTNIITSERNTNCSFFTTRINSNGQIDAGLFSNGSAVGRITAGNVPNGRLSKIAYAYKSGDSALFINGVQAGSTNTGTFTLPSTLDDVFLNDPNIFFAYQESINFNTAALFTSRLTNTQLAELTTVRSGSGGTISYYGPYTIHTFTGSATFTPSFTGPVEVLVVAGGGSGGGQGFNDGSGGGGAGGLLYVSSYGVSQGTGITVTIGAGGAGVTGGSPGNNGSNSVFGGLTAIGGGGGGSEASVEARFGRVGGSGGGAGGYGISYLGGAGIAGQGNKGGDNKQTGGSGINYGGGGGGGAGAPGQDGNNTVAGQLGLGGDGLPYSISGYSTYYAGGGGCGGGYSATGSLGGLGGGGKGGDSATGRAAGTSGVNYTGGGGGGAGGSAVGGSGNSGTGGSGIVIVRYLT